VFVEVAGKLPAATSEKVAAAVIGYGGSGAIGGWTKPSRDAYQALAGRLSPVKKAGMFATPELSRLEAKDVMIDPPSLKEPAYVAVRHHFVRLPNQRME
jgi:hypothetical protein